MKISDDTWALYCGKKNTDKTKIVLHMRKLVTQIAIIYPNPRLTRELVLQVGEVNVCVENWRNGGHLSQGLLLLPLKCASLSIGHRIALPFHRGSRGGPRAVRVTGHWIKCWILIPGK